MMESIRMEMSNYNTPMNLAAKASMGYAMAALLVGMAVMSILLSAAMPTWSHMIRREKEEELVFRGTQYARAINQYQRKFANASPASLDVLIEQRLLRRKFRDPMAPGKDGEFQMLYLGGPGGSRGMGAGPGAGPGAGTGRQGAAASQPGQVGSTFSTTPSGGIVGVTSKNTGTSIRLYKGKSKYNEWQFIGMEMSAQAGPGGGAGGPQRGGPGGREGGPGAPGGRGGFGGRGERGGGGRGDFGGPGGFPGGTRGSGPSPQR
jgi:type II secretory pathway pseudopilin PulG